jgi:crossover junction endodeoxyribonuclease RusA
MIVTLPWPPKELNPNARVHWAQLAKAKKAYRRACWLMTLQQCKLVPTFPGEDAIRLAITFVPPDRRARDDDNLLAAFKAGRDGLADAWGVDDGRFVVTVRLDCENIGGLVRVEVQA